MLFNKIFPQLKYYINKYIFKISITDAIYLSIYSLINYKNFKAIKNTKFENNNYVIYENFLDKNIVSEFLINIINAQKITYNDLIKKNIKNTIIRNLEIYEMNEKIVNDYIFVKKPLTALPKLNSFILDKIVPFAEKLMGGNISVENIQVYGTDFNSDNFKINEKYHFDGDIDKSLKVMIYLTDVEISNGPISFLINDKIINVAAKSGALIAFKAANIMHAGLPPTKPGIRWVLNLKIYPIFGKSRIQYKSMNYFNCTRRFFLFRDMH